MTPLLLIRIGPPGGVARRHHSLHQDFYSKWQRPNGMPAAGADTLSAGAVIRASPLSAARSFRLRS